MSRQKVRIDQLVVPDGTPTGHAPVVLDGELVYGTGGSGGGEVPGPVDLQYDTIDIDDYTGQSDAVVRLDIPSHVAGDENTHPSVIEFPELWNGYRYWMAFTPLPGHDEDQEDPCIAVSQDGTQWETPAGFTNPLDDAGGTTYNSDTELAVSVDGTTLYCIWRQVDSAHNETIFLRSTTDGVTWTARQTIYTAGPGYLSPTVIYDGTQWAMWTVNQDVAPNVLRRQTASAITGTWSAPTNCTITGLPSGREPWHVFIRKLGSQYIGLLADCELATAGLNGDLYLMRSTDGLNWTVGAAPLFARSLANNYTALYRGAFVPTYENGRLEFDVWHGAWKLSPSPIRWGMFRRRVTQAGGQAPTPLAVEDESGVVSADTTVLDFRGDGVTASTETGRVVITVPGGVDGGSTSGELLMQDGVTAPPLPLENEAQDDWLYEG